MNAAPPPPSAPSSITLVTLHYPGGKTPDAMAQERDRAIGDLCAQGHLAFVKDDAPPYHLSLSIENRQLVIRAAGGDGVERQSMILSLSPYRGIIRDYFMMIESYEAMRSEGNHAKLEPIDMARRSLHNEAADMMIERLKDKIVMDHATARRFFTLICVLHMGQPRFWQA